MTTQAVEDYLKAIYKLQNQIGTVSTKAIAEHLEITPASVTGMIKKLAESNLISYERYHGVQLTEHGQKIALEVIRHHRLVELYLAEALGVPWDKVHDEAEKWEHVLSEEIEDRIDKILGYPTVDPHGAPIPTREGKIDLTTCEPLSAIELGSETEKIITVVEVSDRDPEMLRYLGDLNLYPQTEIRVIDVAPFNGPITIKIDDQVHVIGREVAKYIFVND